MTLESAAGYTLIFWPLFPVEATATTPRVVA